LEGNEEDNNALVETSLRQVNSRRRSRDQVLLRVSKKNAMKILADDLRDWITQEAKDTLIVIEILKATQNPSVLNEINPCETRVKEIQRTFARQIIAPMKRFARGSSGARNEEEHCRRFRIVLDNVFALVLELCRIREQTDAILATIPSLSRVQESGTPEYVR